MFNVSVGFKNQYPVAFQVIKLILEVKFKLKQKTTIMISLEFIVKIWIKTIHASKSRM